MRRASSIAANKEHDDADEVEEDVAHLPLGLLLLVPAGHQLAQLLQVPRVVELDLRSPSEDVLQLYQLTLLRLQAGVQAPQLVVQLQSHVCKSSPSVSWLDKMQIFNASIFQRDGA